MGKVAGASAAGDAMSYETVSGALTFNGMGTSLFALGDNGKQDKPCLLYTSPGVSLVWSALFGFAAGPVFPTIMSAAMRCV